MSRDAATQTGAPASTRRKLAHGDDKMDVLHLPHVVDDELRRLPPADRGQLEDRAAPLRRRRDAQLRDLQPAGRARRHVQLGRHGPVKGGKIAPVRSSLGAGAVVDQHQPRAHLHPAAADRRVAASARRRSRRTTRTPSARPRPRPAPTATCRSRTTTTRSWRSCCCRAPTSSISSASTPGSARSGASTAVQVTEWDEPQAVIGSYLQRYAYPDWFAAHREARPRAADDARRTTRAGAARCLQLRGEYLYVAEGPRRLARLRRRQHRQQGRLAEASSPRRSRRSARTRTSPSANATCVALPTNQPIAPAAQRGRADARDEPGAAVPSDLQLRGRSPTRDEGLILVDVNTLADGESAQQLPRARAHLERGRRARRRAAHHARRPLRLRRRRRRHGRSSTSTTRCKPKLAARRAAARARAPSALQFRYLFVTDGDGLQVVDVTDPDKPRGSCRRQRAARRRAAALRRAHLRLRRRRQRGPRDRRRRAARGAALYQMFNADGKLERRARRGRRHRPTPRCSPTSPTARNGLKVLQLTSPESQPKFYGFSPEPKPQLIAWRNTATPALALSKGLDRDRAVDETGGQIAVFGRIGSRPFTWDEMQRLYLSARTATCGR